jgi:hypothetical protein
MRARALSLSRALSRSLLHELEQVRDKEERKLRKELAVAAAEERAVREAEERRDLLVQLEAEVLVEVETQRRAAEESLRQAKELQARRERIAEQRRQQQQQQQQQAGAAADPAPRDLGFVERLRSALGADFVKFQQSFRMPVEDAVGEVRKDDVALALRELPFTPQVACVVGLRSCVCVQETRCVSRPALLPERPPRAHAQRAHAHTHTHARTHTMHTQRPECCCRGGGVKL